MLPAKDSWRGWTVVGSAFVGLLFSVGVLVVYSFGVLVSSMAADFGWSPVQRSTLFVAFSLGGTAAGPIWGAIADRLGGRRVALVSSILLAACFCSLAVSPTNLLVAHVTFAAIGLLGSGTLPAIYANVVVGWFDRHRGLALGLAMTGVGVGAALLPGIAATIITHYGWRAMCVAYAALIALISLPCVAMFLRIYPESGAYRDAATTPMRASIPAVTRQSRTRILAMFAFTTGGVLVASVTNFVPVLQSRGESLVHAAQYQSVLGLSLIAGRVIMGGLIDRIFAPRVMMVVLLVTAAGFLILREASSPASYMIAAIGIGLAIGSEVDFLAFMVSQYFDRAAFTTIFAVLFALYSLGGSAGPLLFGWLLHVSGSYDVGLLLFAVLTLVLSAAMLILPRYGPGG